MMRRSKILLGWVGSETEARRVVEELRERGYDVVYLLTSEKHFFSIPGITVHRDDDSRVGDPPPGKSALSYDPPSAELIEALYTCESIILTMMNRKVETPGESLSLDEKKHIYYNLLRYWRGVIDAYALDAVVFPAVPHSISNFVLYSLARHIGIKTYLYQETTISDRVLLFRRYDESPPELMRAYAKNQASRVRVEDLAPDLIEYYRAQLDESRDATPNDVHVLTKRLSGFNRIRLKGQALVQTVRTGTFLSTVLKRIRRAVGPNLQKEYEHFQEKPDLSKPYVYVAFHWQPECSTSPLGEMYADQILMVETIAAALPEGWNVYVKEHPFQWSKDGVTYFTNMRYRGYYKRIASLPNVSLVPIATDTFLLQKHAKAVATVTGRAAIEGVFRGKYALVFGHAWFQDMPGIIRVKGVESCREALLHILKGGTVDQADVLRYLASLDETTAHGYFDFWGEQQSKLSREESVTNLVVLLSKALDEEKD